MGPEHVVAVSVALAVTAAVAVARYRFAGWSAFSYGTGEAPRWAAADLSRLRFSGCTFAVRRADGAVGSHDVGAALNGMAAAYAGSSLQPGALTLTAPLNAFSFVIPGFNDRASVPDPLAPPWCYGPPAAAGGPCAGAPRAVLSGKFRVLP